MPSGHEHVSYPDPLDPGFSAGIPGNPTTRTQTETEAKASATAGQQTTDQGSTPPKPTPDYGPPPF
jgi:hypothetical protein